MSSQAHDSLSSSSSQSLLPFSSSFSSGACLENASQSRSCSQAGSGCRQLAEQNSVAADHCAQGGTEDGCRLVESF